MIDNVNKDLFWESSIHKDLIITFSDGDVIENSDLESESFTLIEALCSSDELTFGECNASQVSFPIRNIYRSKIGQTFTVAMVINNDASHPIQLGTFKVASDEPTADRTKRSIIGYDALADVLNKDVASWYNTILPNSNSSVTLLQFRESFCNTFGLAYVPESLINDSMIVKKTIDVSTLSGKDVLNAIGEVNGAFPHINRSGFLTFKTLVGNAKGLYPSEELYPSNSLYPKDPKSQLVTHGMYEPPLVYQDYEVAEITRIVVKSIEDSIALSYGTAGNDYVISGNFLLYDKNATELNTIISNLFDAISTISYRPFNVTIQGNPCIEVGDAVRMNTSLQLVETYILQRTLRGIQALKDDISADGTQYHTEKVNSISSQYAQIRGKISSLEVNADGIEGRVEDIENGTASVIQQLSNSISTKVSTSTFNSEVSQLNSSISAKVSATGGVASSFAYELTNSNFKLISSGNTVFECNSNGVTVTGSVKSKSTTNDDMAFIADGVVYVENGFKTCIMGSASVQLADLNSTSNTIDGMSLHPSYIQVTVNQTDHRLSFASGAMQLNGNTILTSSNVGTYAITQSNISSYALTSGQSTGIEVQSGTGLALNAPNYNGWVHVGYSSSAVTIGSSSNTIRIGGKQIAWKKYSELTASDYVITA